MKIANATQTSTKPTHFTGVIGSPKTTRPSTNWIVGARYCSRPMVVIEMRIAAAPKQISGTAVTRPVVVLVGAPGAGKTTVGAALAAALGVEFRDTDHDIERMAGKPIPEIFVDEGEAHFRALERAAVAAALASHPGVLALGGGAVLAEENRRILRAGRARVVWLSADPGVLVDRVRAGGHRPLLDDDPEATLRRMYDQRESLYRAVADAIVSVDGRSVGEVVEAVLR